MIVSNTVHVVSIHSHYFGYYSRKKNKRRARELQRNQKETKKKPKRNQKVIFSRDNTCFSSTCTWWWHTSIHKCLGDFRSFLHHAIRLEHVWPKNM